MKAYDENKGTRHFWRVRLAQDAQKRLLLWVEDSGFFRNLRMLGLRFWVERPTLG